MLYKFHLIFLDRSWGLKICAVNFLEISFVIIESCNVGRFERLLGVLGVG